MEQHLKNIGQKYAQNKGVEDAYIEGGTIQITDRYTVKEEDWNKTASQSDGSPNQVRYLRYANINPGGEYKDGKIIDDSKFRAMEKGVQVKVGTDGHLTPWTVVEDLSQSGPNDTHCEVDYSTRCLSSLVMARMVKSLQPEIIFMLHIL